jgi:hypothetical protein
MENKDRLQEQIEMLRSLIHLVRDQLSEDINIKQLILVLDAVGKGATRLASLIKAQEELGEDETFPETLAEAVRDLFTDSNRG